MWFRIYIGTLFIYLLFFNSVNKEGEKLNLPEMTDSSEGDREAKGDKEAKGDRESGPKGKKKGKGKPKTD